MQDSVSVFCLGRHKLVSKEVPKKSIYVVLYIGTAGKNIKQGLCLRERPATHWLVGYSSLLV
jgi:hypothetical protein